LNVFFLGKKKRKHSPDLKSIVSSKRTNRVVVSSDEECKSEEEELPKKNVERRGRPRKSAEKATTLKSKFKFDLKKASTSKKGTAPKKQVKSATPKKRIMSKAELKEMVSGNQYYIIPRSSAGLTKMALQAAA